MSTPERITFALKVAIAHILYWTGLLWLWQRIALRGRAVVLMYHRVLTPEEACRTGSHPAIVVERDTFARQMETLRNRFVVLSVAEFADRMDRGIPFPDAACLLTFDDGWSDNFANAFPILTKYGLPAVIFLPVNYIGRARRFWQETFTHLVHRAVRVVREDPSRRGRLCELLAPVGLATVFDLPDASIRPMIIDAIRRQKQGSLSTVRATLDALTSELGVGNEDGTHVDGFLTWEQIAEMKRHGVAFGGHGAEHRVLTQVSNDEAWGEVRAAKATIDTRVQEAVPTFSYPNGDWTPEVRDMVQASGYRLAFTTERGMVDCRDDRFALRRVNIHEATTRSAPMFLARLVGLF